MKKFSRRILVVSIWIVSTLFSLPIMISTVYSTKYHNRFNTNVNVCYSQFIEAWQQTYLFISVILFYLLPCFLLFFLYGSIINVIKNLNADDLIASGNESKPNKYKLDLANCGVDETNAIIKVDFSVAAIPKNKSKASNQKEIITLLSIMAFLIMLLLLPYRVFSIWAAFASKEQLIGLGINNYYGLLNFCRVAFYMNSAINPIFYHILSTKFQKAFRNVLKSINKEVI